MTAQPPAEGASEVVRVDVGDDGVAVLVLDDPAHSQNTMNAAYVASMGRAVARLEAEREHLRGVVVTSAKRTFFAGGDLRAMAGAGPGDAAALTALLGRIKDQFRRLERLGRPVVAALNGSALGGGLEIALACHHRVVLDRGSDQSDGPGGDRGDPGAQPGEEGTRIGFPEVTLGLLPGAGGVTRTVRMLGIQEALTTVLLEGRRLRPAQALEIGLVDAVVDSPDALHAAARAWIGAHPQAAQPWDLPGYRIPGGTPSSPALAANLPAFPATLRARLKGAPLPAPKAILAAAVEGAQVDVDTALAIETRYLVGLLTGPVSTNMIKGFFLDLQAVRAGRSRPEGFAPRPARRVAVVGAGMMGAGIASAFAAAGAQVVLQDVSPEAAERGRRHGERLLARAVERGRTSRAAADAVLGRIRATAEVADLHGCDLLVEAVFEDAELKRSVYGRVEPVLAPDALLATNTSTLPVSDLATGVTRPEDFVGLHFFSPVERMPLVEVVVGRRTSGAALARAVDVVRQLGKVPVVVHDARGFFTSRVIGRFLDEAVGMLAEGVHPRTVEQAALQAGYPTGPLALLDEVGLDLTRRIRRAALPAAGAGSGPAGTDPARAAAGPWQPHPAHAVVDRMLDEFGRPGRAARAGFYEYGEDGSRLRLWPGVVEHVVAPANPAARRPRDAGEATAGIGFAELQERLLVVEAVDAVRCLEEGVLRSVEEGNVASLLGIGFPAWTGGALQFVEQYAGGAAGFVATADRLADRYGERFRPPAALAARARAAGAPAGS